MSISISYFAARRLLIEGPGEINSGAWPISWYRIAKGWGMLPYDFWPDQGKVEGTVMPNEPPNADNIAKRERLIHYQRLRSEIECFYALMYNRPTTVALDITPAWTNPTDGLIDEADDQPVVGVHSFALATYDFDTNRFVFPNSWGTTWGLNGFGFLPFGYLARHMVEAWTMATDVVSRQPTKPGVYTLVTKCPDSPLGQPWTIDIYDGDNDVLVGWAHFILKRNILDIEELFIRPEYRRRRHGTDLGMKIAEVATNHSVPARFWIPWGDHCDHNVPSLLAWARKLGLQIEPSNVRWAAYTASNGPSIGLLPKLSWIPEKATCSLETLRDIEATKEHIILRWTEGKATRRAELIEKKYRASLSADEQIEFDFLQEEAGRYQDAIFPLPLD